jgi:hypothetical protein
MRNWRPAVALALCALLVPTRSFAWGFAAHQFIMKRAIDLLPPELKPFYEHYRTEVELRVTDPDLWRKAGWNDDPNHFVNFGVPEYGLAPFVELPRERGAAIEKFGMATITRNGTLPWREEEMFGNLRRGFQAMARQAPYSQSDITFFSSVAAHYMQDAHQPLHATDNYDGQKTGNAGIHARFETDLFVRNAGRLRLSPARPAAIANVRDAAFDALTAGHARVEKILAADREAATGRDTYDDAYFEKFFALVRPLLEEQLSAAITASASMIVTAWEQAGHPVLQIAAAPPTPHRVPR